LMISKYMKLQGNNISDLKNIWHFSNAT